jgi:Uma2 family endonuclease
MRAVVTGRLNHASVPPMNAPLRPPEMSATTQAAEGLMRRRWSVAEIEEMVKVGILSDDERFELIGGEVVPMSPKGLRHERLKIALNRFWTKRLPDAFYIATETTFRMDKDTFLEPDFVFFRASDGLGALAPATALLAVEVADSSLSYDLGRKANLYAAHGVRELWVIDAATLDTVTHREPMDDGYEIKARVTPDRPLVLPFAPEVSTALGALRLP